MNKQILRTMVIVDCLAAFLPYLLIQFVPKISGHLLIFLGFLIWSILTVFIFKIGDWNKKLFWLLALLPIAAGPYLMAGLVYLSFYFGG